MKIRMNILPFPNCVTVMSCLSGGIIFLTAAFHRQRSIQMLPEIAVSILPGPTRLETPSRRTKSFLTSSRGLSKSVMETRVLFLLIPDVRDRRFITYGQGRPTVRRTPCKGITVLFGKEYDLIITYDVYSPSNLPVINQMSKSAQSMRCSLS